MKFVADFHVHSKYSRATAKNLDLENLYIAGQLKGISVVGTGDFTHPEWFDELKSKLEPEGNGLFKLKDDIEKACNAFVPARCRRKVHFILTSEISNIYKKKEKTRKNHNLIFVPDFSAAEKFNARLDRIGNIQSDGRPILGLDARDLLEILLETSPDGFLVPAHIWTPWFSVLGSKSGFDSIQACFEDLTDHIFAVETGLSSDPAMNWRVKSLDGLTLISNSDAHSPFKLGREANIFETELAFSAIKNALRTGDPEAFLGTYEFYPEEGKYHLDGHRKCNFRSDPEQTRSSNGICPVCGNPMTLGVLYRVEQLADRPEGKRPEKVHPYYSIIPLNEVLSELMDVGPNTKKVNHALQRLHETCGSELDILYTLPLESLNKAEGPLFAEAIRRIRQKIIDIIPGYDGEFGKIRLFSPQEKSLFIGQKQLFASQTAVVKKKRKKRNFQKDSELKEEEISETKETQALNDEQKAVIFHTNGPIMVIAGPGTGKTWTITHRIAYLIDKKKIDPCKILAITFTNRAAKEMAERIKKMLPQYGTLPQTTTFHALCLSMLEENNPRRSIGIVDEKERIYYIQEARKVVEKKTTNISCRSKELIDFIIKKKQSNFPSVFCTGVARPVAKLPSWHMEGEAVLSTYQALLDMQGLFDFEDLINAVVSLLANDTQFCRRYRQRYLYLFVDEYQDVNLGQYLLIKLLAAPGKDICVIGDPHQSIYAFRGSDVRYFNNFGKDYAGVLNIHLSQNYRSTQRILDAAQQMLQSQPINIIKDRLISQSQKGRKIEIVECMDETNEAICIGKKIEQLTGGLGFHSMDFGKVESGTVLTERDFSDFAVLFRTAKQGEVVADVFQKAGIPYQMLSKEEPFLDSVVPVLISILRLTEKTGTYVDVERVHALWKSGIRSATMERWKQWAFERRFSLGQAIESTRKYPIQNIKRDQQLRVDVFFKDLKNLSADIHPFSVEEKIRHIIKQHSMSDYSQQLKTKMIQAFIKTAENYGDDTQRFLKQYSFQTDADMYEEKAQKVSLMTMHTAKGLEFPIVFIIGCEDGFLPHQRAKGEGETAEEKRLLYVAMTRAKAELYISYCRKRTVFGKSQQRKPSPFLKAIDQQLVEESVLKTEGKKRQRQLSLF